MDKLWAPWRFKYITDKKSKGCIFCQANRSKDKGYVIMKTQHSLALLNIYPYNNGHIMIAPQRHTSGLSRLKDNELLDIMRCINSITQILDKVLKPQGYNIGINVGACSGAGVTGHLHIHIVPRWRGDTNFMPVLSDSKVISQSLRELSKRLKSALKNA